MIRLTKIANNLHKVELPTMSIWFSYETPIAFETSLNAFKDCTVIAKNIWSNTTGKHLNMISSEKNNKRIDHTEFIKLLEDALE